MSSNSLDAKDLDLILERMIKTVSDSKSEIFQIGEESRREYDKLLHELEDIRSKVADTIDKTDRLEIHYRFARMRLAEVSKHFKDYSEAEVRNAYERAHELQMELQFIRQEEKQLRERRDDLERRLLQLQETVERAEGLVSQITVVLNYLNSDLRQVGELLENAKQRQAFGLQIIEAQEEERRKLSREIHDGPAQMLANVMMRSELIDRMSRTGAVDDAVAEIRDLREMVRSALYEVRRIIYDLRPMALDDLGLIPTLKKYLSSMEEYNKVVIHFRNFGSESRIASKYEVALFRLIQEAVQNAIKHAGPKEIQVKLEIGRKNANVVIKDDGRGFNLDDAKGKSFGLMGMEERVDMLDGQLAIDSKEGAGTVVTIQVPLESEMENAIR